MSDTEFSVDRALRQARSHAARGELRQAEQIYREVLDNQPQNAEAMDALKSVLKRGLKKALKNATPIHEQVKNLNELYKKGDFENVRNQASKLGKSYSNNTSILNILGYVNAKTSRFDQAADNFSKSLQIDPDNANIHYSLAVALAKLDRNESAVASFDATLRIKPDHVEAHFGRANALRQLGRRLEAVESYRMALHFRPEYPEALNNLGLTLNSLANQADAISSFKTAIQIRPNHVQAYINLSQSFTELGQLDNAIEILRQALALDSRNAKAHFNLSRLKRFESDDTDFENLKRLLTRPDLPEGDEMRLSFALAKAYDDINDTDSSFKYLAKANHLRKKELGYNIDSDRRIFEIIKNSFSNEGYVSYISENRDSTNIDKNSIFIVGMPRSGTTLVEQIISNHSLVYGAGELDTLGRSIHRYLNESPKRKVININKDILNDIKSEYFREIQDLGQDEIYITDKQPMNFKWIGFIIASMPNVKIINLNRNPKAVCWSIFKHYFPSDAIGFSFDLDDVVTYYRLYFDMMNFWKHLFPNRIYDLHYENLTERQEQETRKLLDHCGLDWERQCLDFHENARAIRTASNMQVRQKMYTGSSNEWRKYETQLAPFFEPLDRLDVNSSSRAG